MDREELKAMIKAGPVKIFMNDGREYEIAAPDEAPISDIAAHVLYLSKTDGKLKAMILPMLSMPGMEPLNTL